MISILHLLFYYCITYSDNNKFNNAKNIIVIIATCPVFMIENFLVKITDLQTVYQQIYILILIAMALNILRTSLCQPQNVVAQNMPLRI